MTFGSITVGISGESEPSFPFFLVVLWFSMSSMESLDVEAFRQELQRVQKWLREAAAVDLHTVSEGHLRQMVVAHQRILHDSRRFHPDLLHQPLGNFTPQNCLDFLHLYGHALEVLSEKKAEESSLTEWWKTINDPQNPLWNAPPEARTIDESDRRLLDAYRANDRNTVIVRGQARLKILHRWHDLMKQMDLPPVPDIAQLPKQHLLDPDRSTHEFRRWVLYDSGCRGYVYEHSERLHVFDRPLKVFTDHLGRLGKLEAARAVMGRTEGV